MLKKIGRIIAGIVVFIAAMSAIDEYLLDGAIKSLLRAVISSPIFWALSVTLGLFVWVDSGRRKWAAWIKNFRYAGKGRSLDLTKVAPSRLMKDIKYVPIQRALERPRSLEMAQPAVEKISEDADAFFLGRRQDPAFLQTRWGFLIQGTALVGKTRFVGEWIRRHFPDAFVLVPDPTNVPPEIPGRLRRKSQVCLLLDDLDEFREHVAVWCRWIETLRDGKGSILVWSTVRDGGPGYEVQDTPAFRPIRTLNTSY